MLITTIFITYLISENFLNTSAQENSTISKNNNFENKTIDTTPFPTPENSSIFDNLEETTNGHYSNIKFPVAYIKSLPSSFQTRQLIYISIGISVCFFIVVGSALCQKTPTDDGYRNDISDYERQNPILAILPEDNLEVEVTYVGSVNQEISSCDEVIISPLPSLEEILERR